MIKKAVIPAAGYGTRFLPATKSQPKEMLPIVDTPTIQYVVQEAIDSGIRDILMIIGKGKRSIEEHFARNFELEKELESKNKEEELKSIMVLPDDVRIHFVWQNEMRGLGDAILHARDHVGKEAFAVLLGDTILESYENEPVTRQLINIWNQYEEAVVALEEVEEHKVSKYGIADGEPIDEGLFRIDNLIEKPSPAETPSRMAVASRYILPPEIFSALEGTGLGKNNEIQLSDAMQALLKDRPMYGLRFNGKRHDIGNKLDFVKTTLLYALKRDDMKKDLISWLGNIVGD
jgi:UTP--glucose-1-phosphate uridylyltransferase